MLNVIERVYTKTPWMQKLEDESMIDICKEEEVSPEQVFFALLCCLFYRYGLYKHNFFVCEGLLMKILGFIFSDDKQKKSCRIF